MARREDLTEALDAIETGMCRVKESRGIWQNDLVYALCQAARLLLMEELRHGIPVEAPSPDAAAEITPPRAGMDSGSAADVAPVVHGRWIVQEKYTFGTMYDCSICGTRILDNGHSWNYCPNCGAKMDGGVTDEMPL